MVDSESEALDIEPQLENVEEPVVSYYEPQPPQQPLRYSKGRFSHQPPVSLTNMLNNLASN